ncbi:HEAT repeat-containing protein 6 [Mortierella polycephala]|uniref:HEAT repeat-containing protein 6 n=1 Tax=Mortierella polycephala TaxID=41804 RepID=A0A9P6PPR7_9FUNG|nr:HEAT repeat-containing protein 6 [Mortierella polycephala]
MTQTLRQRHYRHHRPPSAQQRQDTEDNARRHPPQRQTREAGAQAGSDCLSLSEQDKQQLNKDLILILERAKAHGSESTPDNAKEPKDMQEFSKARKNGNITAIEKLGLACAGFSSTAPEDVEFLAKVVFALFNKEMIKVDAERVLVDILRALSAALFENGLYAKDSFPELFQIIISISTSQKRTERSELRRMAMNSLANAVHKTGTLYSSYHERMYEVLLSNLTSTSYYESGSLAGHSSMARRKDLASERKLISSALRALHFLLQEDKQISSRSIPPLMDVICRFMFFKTETSPGQPGLATSSNAFHIGIIKRTSYATPTNILPFTKSTGATGSQHPPSDVNAESSFMSYRNMQSSDSEYSDSELGAHLTQRRQHDGKVRLNALLCLQALARAAPKQLQPHWPKFLTHSSYTPTVLGTHKAPSLIGLIGSDPIPTVRSAACVVLSHILESSKQYLAMAEEKLSVPGTKTQAGMLVLSERIGLMMRELHVGVRSAMNGVDSSLEQGVVIQMIKCCSAVVANCSYEKMRPGLSLLLFNSVKTFLNSNEPGLQSAALLFMSALLSNTTARTDVQESILSNSTPPNSNVPDFLAHLMEFVEDANGPPAVRIEAWSTLRVLAQFHFEAVRPLWTRLDACMVCDQNSDDLRVRTGGLLFLEEFSKSGASASEPLMSEWWTDVLERHVLKAFAEENPSIKALGCDCISHISPNAFIGLPDRFEMIIMSLILGTALDENAAARAAACRAIGVFILFPSLREESSHLVDMANTILDLCRDPNLAVRVRASWAVGNLCDSLVLMKTENQGHVLEETLTLTLWTKIMRSALMICQDHEKLKSNGIRAIGGLLRVTFEGILERERHSLVKEAVYALIKHMEQGSLKGRWNACYAMRNVLLNPDFPIGSTFGTSYALGSDMVSWTRDVYGALMHAIQQSKNFKVRINACAALTVPKTRAKYGDQAMFRDMVQVLMNAVKNLDEEQGEHEFGEFQYRGQLENKILRCLDHLLQLSGGMAKLDLELDPTLRQRIIASRPEMPTLALQPQEAPEPCS